jgi:hypothetical protein
MAAIASLQLTGYVDGTPTGTNRFSASWSSAAANGSVLQLVLQAGDNTITNPTSPAPNGCVIKLPSDNTSVTTFKGTGADTGYAIGKVTTQVINWDATAVPTSFVLASVSTQTGKMTEIKWF